MSQLLLIFYSLLLFGFQEPGFVLVKSINEKGDFITTDNLDNIYLVAKDRLFKYDKDGNFLYVYTNKIKGKIDYVDVTDPMKILVFYKDFGLIAFLDNTLSIKGEPIELNKLNFELSSLACASYPSGIWLYDPQSLKLIRINKSLLISQQSGNINQLTGLVINPVFMTEYNENIYLCDPKAGVFVFDKFGAYFKTINLKGISNFQIIKDKLYYLKDDKMGLNELNNFGEDKLIPLPLKEIKMIQVRQKKICILNNDGVSLYNIIENNSK
jgi:hypothetical protein